MNSVVPVPSAAICTVAATAYSSKFNLSGWVTSPLPGDDQLHRLGVGGEPAHGDGDRVAVGEAGGLGHGDGFPRVHCAGGRRADQSKCPDGERQCGDTCQRGPHGPHARLLVVVVVGQIVSSSGTPFR